MNRKFDHLDDAATTGREILHQQGLDDYTETVAVPSWGELASYLHELFYRDSWIFRGQNDSTWGLQPSLERVGGTVTRKDAERLVLCAFKRRAHQYLVDLPAQNDELGWLALMQHHGVPTRLLDWTRSPYVALYFAMEQPVRGSCALWIVNHTIIKTMAVSKAQDALTASEEPGKAPCDLLSTDESLASPQRFRKFFIDDPIRFVAPLQPHMMNERLTIQQGLFLCGGDPDFTFDQNLLLALRYGEMSIDGFLSSKPLIKLIVPGTLRSEVLRELRRMNVTSANLFPGLDGFARSLLTELAIISSTPTLDRFMDGDALDQI